MPDARVAHPRAPAGSPSRWWGVLAFAFYAVHAGYYVYQHQAENVLWSCHLASVLVGVGFILRSPTANAIGFLWLLLGNPLWLTDLATGDELLPTSLLTHVGGLVLSLMGLKAFGMPRQVWWKAALAFLALQEVCRWVTPPAANVNLAFAVWSGWERMFPSYGWYMAMLTVGLAGTALIAERLGRYVIAAFAAGE